MNNVFLLFSLEEWITWEEAVKIIAYLHQSVGAGAHECVHCTIKGIIMRISSHVTNSFTWGAIEAQRRGFGLETCTEAAAFGTTVTRWSNIGLTCRMAVQQSVDDLALLRRAALPGLTGDIVVTVALATLWAVCVREPSVAHLRTGDK